ncbi:glycoside hydrolase family 28 [Halosimplex carlsbadense 2-9-1]|uniref:Glycoside hydrolase family 28 n=1 Tax=Halosimplex carlsbadense 2-9-1 TaxID=797114 RepID=M0CDS4_9EURY|nr:glycoside hydrolase family 28 protein [Halosimplex carlsbadense]ELZ20009.1 glycoside hydrolase family 28 [Halosimplex carlsbadense 2-9-1]
MTDSDGRRDVRDFGAVGTGDERDTAALQSALDECAGTGGTVVVPSGKYLTGPLTVGSHTTLELEAGATLSFVRDHEAFPARESRWEGWEQTGFHPCLLVAEAENVEITGRGTVDGQGDYWWQFYGVDDDELPASLADRLDSFHEANDKADDVSSFTLRPPLFQVDRSTNVSVSGITLRNSPFWNTHVVYSDNVTLHDVNVENPADAPNGDGIDIDSSRYVRISDCYLNAGDDAVCIKSGKDEEGRRIGRPASGITVTNCTVEAGHGGVVIGSEMSGDVRDVTVSNCTFTDTDRGIRIKTQRGRGGVVEDCRFDNLVMRRVACPFTINGYYFMDIDSDPIPVDESTPMVRNIAYSDIIARDVETAGFFAGLPEQRFENISFSNVEIDATRSLDATDLSPAMADGFDQRHGLFCKSITDISLSNVRIRTADGPALAFEETGRVSIDGLHVDGDQETPIVDIRGVDETLVSGCDWTGEGTFLRVRGDESGRISFAGNHGDLADGVAAPAVEHESTDWV